MAEQIKSIVLVHGAFADGSSWAKVIPLLTSKGFKAVAVQNPLSSLADDVKAALRAIEMQDGPVLLVGHSWGGAVITEAGNHPQVAGLLYVAAGAPDSGQSFNDWWKDYPPAPGAAQIKPYGKDCAALTQEGVHTYFAQDLAAEEADLIWAVQGPLGVGCFDSKISKAAWHNKPSWYVVSENDLIIPPAVERASAKQLQAETLSLKTSHVPMLSQPQAVADFIIKAATALSEGKTK